MHTALLPQAFLIHSLTSVNLKNSELLYHIKYTHFNIIIINVVVIVVVVFVHVQ